jgi:hypothetical protein
MQPIIFVDMDGVLVNLRKGLSDYLGVDIENASNDEWNKHFYSFSDKISDTALCQFYSKLPQTQECMALWTAVKFYKPLILTSISNRKPVIFGKELWCFQNLAITSDRIYCSPTSAGKQEYASKKGLLIDDYKKNVEQWREAGGTAIHHTSIDSTLEQFKDFIAKNWHYSI